MTSTKYTVVPRQTTYELVMRYVTKTVVPRGVGKCSASAVANGLAERATVVDIREPGRAGRGGSDLMFMQAG
jgi:hypothetical protein